MPRFTTTVETPAALAAGSGTPAFNLVAGASANFKPRQILVGFRAVTITSAQITLGIFRATARGTASTTVTPLGIDPRAASSAITGLDTAWSVAPTFAANPLDRISLNDQSSGLVVYEFPDDWTVDQGTANGFGGYLIGNALPSTTLLTIRITHDE